MSKTKKFRNSSQRLVKKAREGKAKLYVPVRKDIFKPSPILPPVEDLEVNLEAVKEKVKRVLTKVKKLVDDVVDDVIDIIDEFQIKLLLKVVIKLFKVIIYLELLLYIIFF